MMLYIADCQARFQFPNQLLLSVIVVKSAYCKRLWACFSVKSLVNLVSRGFLILCSVQSLIWDWFAASLPALQSPQQRNTRTRQFVLFHDPSTSPFPCNRPHPHCHADQRQRESDRNRVSDDERAKYEKKYSKEWESGLKDWIRPQVGDNTKAFCRFCKCEVRAYHADLIQHAGTEKHKKAL